MFLPYIISDHYIDKDSSYIYIFTRANGFILHGHLFVYDSDEYAHAC